MEALPDSMKVLPDSMEALPAEKNPLSFKAAGKPKKRLKPLFLGSSLENTKLSDFARHGVLVPIYTHTPGLVLLFKNHADCRNYLKRLYAIKTDFQACDPLGVKPDIQGSIIFVNKVIESLI
jgi:hypothetical protein